MLQKKIVQDFFIINIGLFICSLGVVNFLIPSKLAAGGVSGIAAILFYILELPVGVTMMALNIPLFILGYLVYGREYAFQCLLGILLFPVYASFSENYFTYDTLTAVSEVSPLTGAVFAGVIIGLGAGVTVAAGGSTGGSIILAQVISKFSKLPVGRSMFIVDSLVVISSVFIFGIRSAVLALLCIFIMGKIVDLVINSYDFFVKRPNKTSFA